MSDALDMPINLLFNSQGLQGAGQAMGKGLSKASKDWIKEIKSETTGALSTAFRAAVRDRQTEEAWRNMVQSPVISMSRHMRQLIESNRTHEASLLHDQFRLRIRQQKQLIEQREKALAEEQDRQLKAIDEQVDTLKSGVQGLGQNILSGDLGSLFDMLRAGGRTVRERGLAREQRAKEVEKKDPALAANLGKMGGQLAKIGSSLMVFAAVAGSLVMLVKLFMDLESKAVDMNKALISTAGAADYGLSAAEIAGGGLSNMLSALRDETTAVNDNFMAFRATAQEQQEILSGFNQAGLTFAKMRQEIDSGTSSMQSFSDVTAIALTYSKTLGISTGEVSQAMAEFTLQTGRDLGDIAEQFSAITREAMMAGLSTKRFYSAVVEASTGMAFYGTRIEDVSRLLAGFDTLLGESMGPEVFKQLVGRYQDKGMQDRLKDLIIKDQEFTQEQFSKSYQRTLQGLVRDFGSTLEQQGVSVDEILKSGSEVEMRKRLADLGIQAQKQQDFLAAYRLRGAVEAGPGASAAAMAALPYAGPGFDIAQALRSSKVLEQFGSSVGEVYETALRTENQAVLVALEQLAESSGKSLDQLIALDNQGRASFERLREVRDGIVDKVPEDLAKLGFFIDKQTGDIKRGYYDATNTLVKDNAVAIRDSFDVLSSTPTEGEDTMLEALTRDQEIASEIARNTTTTANVLEQTIAGILNDIYGVVEVIADFLADDRIKQQKLAAQQQSRARREELAEQAKIAQAQVDTLSDKIQESLKDGDQETAKQLQSQLDLAKTEATKAELALSRQETVAKALENLTDEMVKMEGAGASAVISALERSGDKIFASDKQRDQFVSALDEALPRFAESTSSGWDYFTDEFMRNMEASSQTPEQWAQATREKLLDPAVLSQIAGGGQSVDAAIKQGIEAAKKAEADASFFATDAEERRSMAEAFSTAVSTSLAQQLLPQTAKEQVQGDAIIQQLQELNRQASSGGVSGFDLARTFLGQMRQARDVIIPARGTPVITDSRDTIMAMRPGGPIDAASKSGSRNNVTFNITVNSAEQLYNTFARMAKALELV